MVPVIFAVGRQLPVYSSMAVCGGRRQRFIATLGLVVTDTLILCIGVLVISGLSIVMARFMPTFTVEGKAFSFEAIDPRVAILALIFLPFGYAMQLVFYGMPFLLFVSLPLPFEAVMFLSIAWRGYVEQLANPLSVASLILVSWFFFLLIARHICFRWCLVGGRRGR